MADIIEARVFSTLSGSPPGIEVYPVVAKQNCKPPFLTYEISNSAPEMMLSGANLRYNAQCILTAIAESYLGAKRVITSAVDAMLGAEKDVFVIGSFSLGEDIWEPETGLYMNSATFSLWFVK